MPLYPPADVVVSFGQSVYRVTETVGQFEVCVSLIENVSGAANIINFTVISQNNNTATG